MDSSDGSATTDRGLQSSEEVLQEILNQARMELEKITAMAQVAAAARDDATKSQATAAAAATKAQESSEAVAVTGQAAALTRDAVVTAVTDAQARLAEISAIGQAAVAARDAAKESQATAVTAATEAQAKASEIATVATQALAAQTQITDAQAIIATKSDHIEGAQKHADDVRAKLDRTLTGATQQATEAEALKSRAQSAADLATGVLAEIRAGKGTADAEVAAATVARETAEECAVVTKALADKSATVEERIAAYENRLAQLEKLSEERLKQIVELLPGATSAGLAHAWDARRQTFLQPQKRWQWVFVGSLIAIILLALTGLLQFYWPQIQSLMGWSAATTPGSADTLSLEHLLRVWLARLPVIAALVWLAIHASRESALAKRLEEEYGFKATTAAAFVGFKDMMAKISQSGGDSKLLADLCENTLTTMAMPPGRHYDKHKLVHSPLSEVAQVIDGAGKAARHLKPNVPGM